MRNTATIGFIMSHACPLKCDFCCHDRQVLGPRRIRRDDIERHMIAFGAEESVTRFGFSGGEPFLYYDDIVSAIAAARAAGVTQPFSMITSGYWGKQDDFRERMAELHGLGMDRIHISHDTEHARWVGPNEIRNISLASRELGIRVEIYASFWHKEESIHALLPDVDEWADEINSYWVLRSGRARRSGRRADHDMPEESKYSCGKPTHYTIAINPDGRVYPCCAGEFNQAAKISCGDIRTDSPAQILENAYSNFHVRMVKELGWRALYDLIRREYSELLPRLPKFEDVDSPCEICRDLNVTLKEELRPIYERIETVYAETMAEREVKGLGSSACGHATFDFAGTTGSADKLPALIAADAMLRRKFVVGADQIAAL